MTIEKFSTLMNDDADATLSLFKTLKVMPSVVKLVDWNPWVRE